MLFGDEKDLSALAGTGLFGPGRLSWELLRCHPVHPPFVWRAVGAGSLLLVVENQATFDSLSRVLPGDGPVGMLAYGAGNHFTASVASATGLPRPVDRIVYFGDVDAQGLAIPVRASMVAAAMGLPPIEPAGALHELTLRSRTSRGSRRRANGCACRGESGGLATGRPAFRGRSAARGGPTPGAGMGWPGAPGV